MDQTAGGGGSIRPHNRSLIPSQHAGPPAFFLTMRTIQRWPPSRTWPYGVPVCRTGRRRRAAWTAPLLVIVWLLSVSLQNPAQALAATNSELIPGSRIVFPYYDLREGISTFLTFTNVSSGSATLHLEFYDASCLRRDSSLHLSAGDTDLLDVGAILQPGADGLFRQGFVDVVTFAGDALLGTAIIVNGPEDWGIVYHGAAARRLSSGPLPFEPYPSRLFLPAFLTQGSLGSGHLSDGLLVVAAPHPTQPGGELPDPSLQPTIRVFLDQEPAFQLTTIGGNVEEGLSTATSTGHQLLLPIGQAAGTFPTPRFGWLSVTNQAIGETGTPIGIVGLYIQTIAGDGSGMGMAIRLWADPASGP